jgi:translation initiation factor IF-2
LTTKSKITLFKLARNLNLATATIQEYLESLELPVPSSPMKKLTLESWEAVIEKFDAAQYKAYKQGDEPGSDTDAADASDLRKKGLEELLQVDEKPDDEKIELPRDLYNDLKVIKQAEPVEEIEEDAVEEDPPETPEESIELELEPESEPAVEQEAPKSNKLDLPSITASKILKHAPTEAEKKAVLAKKKQEEEKEKEKGAAAKAKTAKSEQTKPEKKQEQKQDKKRKRTRKLGKGGNADIARMKSSLKGGDSSSAEQIVEGVTRKSVTRRRKGRKAKVDEKEMLANIREAEKAMESRSKKKKHRRVQGVGEIDEEKQILRVTEFITTSQLAKLLDQTAADLITKTFEMGQLITINQRMDRTLIELLCADFEFEVEFISGDDELEEEAIVDLPEDMQPRQPVVTIMGHVDHGKTTLLDYLRETKVVDGEAGGITQHIGAYEVDYNGSFITFLDTPGHHSFSAMRARGANVTDIVVLVVAADDAVQQQTLEAIDHARAAEVPIIIAINKIDKPNADPERVRKELSAHNLLVEAWGGDIQSVDISAKKGENVDKLMDEILLRAEMLELKGNPTGEARGIVLESEMDKGRGAVATVLIQRGTLHKAEPFVAGAEMGRVRLMVDENGKVVKEAGPGKPIQITGLSGVPQAGDTLVGYKSEKEARQVMLKKQQLLREQSQQKIQKLSLESLTRDIKDGEVNELSVIIKGDVAGSVEAIADEVMKLANEEVRVNVIHKAVGAITESDVMLAVAGQAFIIGFHVHPTQNAREEARLQNVDIRIYRIIYDITNDIKLALEGLLRPEEHEEVTATLEVREVFKISKIGSIAGCMVVSGKITRSERVRLMRDNVEVYTGNIAALKRFKDDAKEVAQGYDCGVQIANFNDIKQGDIIESFKVIEIKRTLDM